MPIYVESRDLNANLGFVAEHQYLVYIPVDEESNYSAWKYIGAFPSAPDIPDGSILTRASIVDDLFKDAVVDRWKMNEFSVAALLDKDPNDVTVSEMVAEGYAGPVESIRHRELINVGSALSEENLTCAPVAGPPVNTGAP